MDKIKACLFDFDGTLVDSMPVWAEKMFRLLKLCGITPPEGLLREITPLGDKGTMEYYKNRFEINMTTEEMQAEMDAYAFPKYANEIPEKEGVSRYLKYLKENNVGIYLLTASPRKMFEPCLKRLGLYDYFDDAWSCEDFGTVKSDVNIYHMAAKKMGVDPCEAMFFDDNKNALITAKKSGMITVGVFDESSTDDKEEIKKISSLYVHNLCELIPGF